MYKCPVTYYKDNLIFGADGSCWAVFELQGFDYDLLAEDSKVRIFQRLTALLSNIASEAKFQIIPVSQDLDALYEQLQNELLPSDPLHETALYQSGEVKEYLRQMVNDNGKSNDYKTFFYVKLNKSMEDDIVQSVQDAFDFLVKSITQDIHALFQIDTKDIRSSKVRRYVKTMEQTHLEQSQRLTLLKPTTDTVQWLLRRPMVRGLAKVRAAVPDRQRRAVAAPRAGGEPGRSKLPAPPEPRNGESVSWRDKKREPQPAHGAQQRRGVVSNLSGAYPYS